MRVAFVYPATEFDKKYHAEALPTGLLYLTAVAEQRGAQVDLFDSRHWNAIPDAPHVNDYDLIGFTAMSMQVPRALSLVRKVRRSGYKGPIAFGGPHATVATDHLKQQSGIDAIFIGEAETTFPAYLDWLDGKPTKLERIWTRNGNSEWTFHPGEYYVENLDDLPFPARYKYADQIRQRRFVNLLTARGCPFDCTYCQPTKRMLFGNRVRRRTTPSIIAELHDCVDKFAIDHFFIDDDTFTFNRRNVLEFCEAVKPLGLPWGCQTRSDIDRDTLVAMRAAGCIRVNVGVESGSQRMLDMMNKRNSVERNAQFVRDCHDVGIHTWCNVMVGYPGETQEDLDDSLHFVLSTRPDLVVVTQVTPFPGTHLWQTRADDVIAAPWDKMARHVMRAKFKSMADYQKRTARYQWLMSREFGEPINAEVAGEKRALEWAARRVRPLYRLLAKRRKRVIAAIESAVALAREGKIEEAIAQLELIRRKYPRTADVHGNLAWLYRSAGQVQKAAESYRMVLKLQPQNEEAKALLQEVAP